jgi:hypothetical protein
VEDKRSEAGAAEILGIEKIAKIESKVLYVPWLQLCISIEKKKLKRSFHAHQASAWRFFEP